MVLLADERWVPVDHQDRNERLVREVLLTGKAEQAQFLSLLPTPDDATVATLKLYRHSAVLRCRDLMWCCWAWVRTRTRRRFFRAHQR